MRKEEEEGSGKKAMQSGEGGGPVRTVPGYCEGLETPNRQCTDWCSGTPCLFSWK